MARKYSCAICNRKFSRKWNANRHNNTFHPGMSNVFNNETGILLDSKKFHTNHEISEVDQEEINDQILLNLFGKMLQKFEELEYLISQKADNEKTRHLSELLVAALMTSNPVKALDDTISYHRSLRAKIKFVDYISKNMQISPILAESFLLDLIKNNHWIKKGNQQFF